MARPAKTIHTAKALHALILQELGPGAKIPRPVWDQIVVQGADVGINQASNISKTGEAAGLWLRKRSLRDGAGHVQILGASVASAPA